VDLTGKTVGKEEKMGSNLKRVKKKQEKNEKT
jgi:hypothetical protein